MVAIKKQEDMKMKIFVTLTAKEKEQYDELLERIEMASTATEVKVYNRRIWKLIKNAQTRQV